MKKKNTYVLNSILTIQLKTDQWKLYQMIKKKNRIFKQSPVLVQKRLGRGDE